MKNLKIGRRWFCRDDAVPAFQFLNVAKRPVGIDPRDQWRFDGVIHRFVMVEGDLSTFASGLLSRRLLGLAVTVR